MAYITNLYTGLPDDNGSPVNLAGGVTGVLPLANMTKNWGAEPLTFVATNNSHIIRTGAIDGDTALLFSRPTEAFPDLHISSSNGEVRSYNNFVAKSLLVTNSMDVSGDVNFNSTPIFTSGLIAPFFTRNGPSGYTGLFPDTTDGAENIILKCADRNAFKFASNVTVQNSTFTLNCGLDSLGKISFTELDVEYAYISYEKNQAVGLKIAATFQNEIRLMTNNLTRLIISETIRFNGALQPASLANADAANDSVYYSTTASKLVYKDSGGTVNNLY